jgi:hypothetical protein
MIVMLDFWLFVSYACSPAAMINYLSYDYLCAQHIAVKLFNLPSLYKYLLMFLSILLITSMFEQ